MLESYKGKRVLVTGHTGFKGTWLCRTLLQLDAEVYGIGLDEGEDKIFSLSKTADDMHSFILNIRDRKALHEKIQSVIPKKGMLAH